MHIVNQKTHGMIWLCGTRHSGSFEQTDLDLDRLKGSTPDSPVPVVLHNFINYSTVSKVNLSITIAWPLWHASQTICFNASWRHVQSVITSA